MRTLVESIRPSSDLRNHYNEISKQCKSGKEAVIITVNGRGDTVSLGYEEYLNLKARIELLESWQRPITMLPTGAWLQYARHLTICARY